MPLVRIEILKGRPTAEKSRLLQAIHAALVQAFGIPQDDRTQRLIEHDPENFEIPPGGSENYILVEITAFPGRSLTAKRALGCQGSHVMSQDARFSGRSPPEGVGLDVRRLVRLRQRLRLRLKRSP